MADQGQTRGRRERRSRRRQQREQEETRRRRRYMMFGGAFAAAVLLIIVLTVVNQTDNGDDVAPDFREVQVAGDVHENVESEAYFLGDPDAPVHLIEWSDFQ